MFGEIPSQTHIWDEGVHNNHTKTLVNSFIYRLYIIVNLAIQAYSIFPDFLLYHTKHESSFI
jgi:hypothetical protein